jgi:hypothetical protein
VDDEIKSVEGGGSRSDREGGYASMLKNMRENLG